jgi:hypothetical protein
MDSNLFELLEWQHIAKHTRRKILQLIPSPPGWRCAFKSEGRVTYTHIVCWALCVDQTGEDTYQTVVPTVVTEDTLIEFPDSSSNFFKIVAPGEDALDPLELAKLENKETKGAK